MDADVAQAMADERTIFLSKGMLFAIRDEVELVAVLGHEVGHIELKHLDERLQDSPGSSVIGEVVEGSTGVPIGNEIKRQIEKIRWSQFNQKMEQETDEFGVMIADRLGYDSYALAELLDRLSQYADPQIFDRLRENGSHQSLFRRADHVRHFLKDKGIAKKEKINTQRDIENVHFLAGASAHKSDLKLDGLFQEVQKKGKHLSVSEFLETMARLRSVASELNLLGQLDPPQDFLETEEADDFMMELVRVPSPIWAGQDPNLIKIRRILAVLGRMSVGMILVVGDAIDLTEALTGRDFYSQKELTYGERVASVLGLLVSTGSQWRSVARELEIVGDENKGLREATSGAREAIEEAPLSFEKKKIIGDDEKINSEQAKEAQATYRRIKNEENEKVLKDLAEEIRNSRDSYVTQRANGKTIDRYGRVVLPRSDEAHIPLKDYKFWKFWSGSFFVTKWIRVMIGNGHCR